MPEPVATDLYTIEDAEDHIGDLRGDADILGEALTQADTDLTPNTPTTGNIQFSAAGHQKYVSSDGQDYNTGRGTYPATAGLTVSTSMQTIPGLSAALGVGNYRVRAQLCVNVPATGGQGALTYRTHATGGLTASGGRTSIIELFATTGVGLSDYAQLDVTLTGSTPGGGAATRIVQYDGYFEISVAGTINIQMAQAATAAVNVVQFGTYLDIYPVS